ncbi:DUF6210 family protein [Kitasatospora griseola]|uniref:DUF6210 family protein n=1 Tax=Kitasatospora griseola TaxID=2064 RepID=UPI003657C8A2
MGFRRVVFLDPDGTSGGGWLFALVEAPTRVVHQHQYGGTACRMGQVEGFLMPLFAPAALDALRELFERHFRGAGTWSHSWPDDERHRLRAIVATVRYWTSDGTTEQPHPLCLDETRLDRAEEAWVPVLTPDGPAVLVRSNSDRPGVARVRRSVRVTPGGRPAASCRAWPGIRWRGGRRRPAPAGSGGR